MQTRFEAYIEDDCGIHGNAGIILTVSGGIDSVVMLDLFSHTHYKCAIAHCNFNLRDDESQADEDFVRTLENKYGYPVHVKSFNTLEFAEKNRLSVQMAARELRYSWFENLRQELDFEFIATAHNLDDLVETFFINLSRGTGVKGLAGIRERTGRIIRPLLWAERSEIVDYAGKMELEWREDSSNSTTKYLRNKLRHEILPLFRELNPAFTETMRLNTRRIRNVVNIYMEETSDKKSYLLEKERDSYKIPIDVLLKEKYPEIWLFEILQDFGFSPATIEDILKGIRKQESGKRYYSEKYRLVRDREYLLLEEIAGDDIHRYYIDEDQSYVDLPLNLKLEQVPADKFSIERDYRIAQLDMDKLNFPLIIRKWEKGDYFMPLGMDNLKKMSDFFIDLKLSIPEKEKIWLLTSGKHIVWVIGKRIDERYKVTGETEMVLKISLV